MSPGMATARQAHPATPMATARAHPTLFRRPRHYYTRASRLVTFPYWGAAPMATARAHPTLFRRPRHYYTRASRLVTFPYWGVALHHLTNRPFVKNLATRN